MRAKITKKQMLILDFIETFTQNYNYSPSYREIMKGLGLSSVSAVAEHIDNLVRKGALKKSPGEARSLQVVDLSHPETTDLFKKTILTATPEEIEILERAAEILGLEL